MIPTRLTIQGLYSYRESQTIDFTKLTEARLFGIFGGVGSGKSSILEAISFAMYGKTERLNERENRNYNMMNLKSNSLLIDFEFKGNDQALYRFVVKGSRNGKNFDIVNTFDRAAYKKTGEEWIPIDKDSAESITGLKYDNFKRTIIIPQGRFQEFLQLGATERVGMLKELFNLQKYDFSDKVSQLEKLNEANLNILKGQLSELPETDPATMEAKAKELNLLSETLKEKGLECDEKQKLQLELDKLQQLTGKIIAEKVRLETLQASAKEIDALEAEINQFEALSLTFRADFEYLDRLRKSIDDGTLDIEKQRLTVNALTLKEQELKAAFAALKPAYDTNHLLATEAEELNKLAEMKEARTNAGILKGRIETGKKMIQEMLDTIQALKATSQQLMADIFENKKLLPDIQVLHAVKAWFTEKDRLNNSTAEAKKRNADTAASLQALQTQSLNLYSTSNLFADSPESADIEAFLSRINVLKLSLDNEKEVLNAEISRVAVQHELEQYADALEEGKPCPLCGSEHHPQKLNAGNVATLLQQLNGKKVTLDGKYKAAETLERNFIRLQAELHNNGKQQKSDEQALQQAGESVQKHLEGFVWIAFDPNDALPLQQAFVQYDNLLSRINKSETTQLTTVKEIEKKELEKEKSINGLRGLEDQLNALDSRVDLLSTQIQHIDVSALAGKEAADLRLLSADKLQKQKEIVLRYNATDEELKKNQQALSGLKGKLDQSSLMLKSLQEQQTALLETITQKLLQAGGLTLEFVNAVLNKNMQVAETKKKITRFRQDVASLKEYISKLELELGGKAYDAPAHELLKVQIEETLQYLKAETKNMHLLSAAIDRLKADALKYAALKLESDKLTLRAEDITELKRLFYKNGFIDFVSTAHLRNLCYAANDRLLKLTRQQLGIELAPDNTFVVRDYMNEGKTRSVKTLSGGQTFQASLSLALSLADSIHAQSGTSENFFFLDEGFGSLDKDTLSVVFESLKALRKENRIVGFISHVEEMQQQIETYIRVVNREDKGSLIKRSWEEN